MSVGILHKICGKQRQNVCAAVVTHELTVFSECCRECCTARANVEAHRTRTWERPASPDHLFLLLLFFTRIQHAAAGLN